ncbi:MAG: GNAT family N-acetyltransferase [Flammeovirgaceae bacterium]|nr:GNAT family N-acetyltransferase [Flammeovirgaceae bacterium]
MDILVRRAKSEEFLAIAALDRVAWTENRYSQYIPDGEHVWKLWVEHAYVFVAVVGEEIVGVIQAFPCLTPRLYSLHKVFVRKDYRGQKVGSMLMEVFLKEMDRVGGDCFLTVDPVNERAIALYEKWGFHEKVFYKGYYRPEEDRFVMTRRAKSV